MQTTQAPVKTYTDQPVYVREYGAKFSNRGAWLADYMRKVEVFADGSARMTTCAGGAYTEDAAGWKLR